MALIADNAGDVRSGGGRIRPARVDVAGQRAAAMRNRQDAGMSAAARRAIEAADAPAPPKQRFVHETDIDKMEPIRRTGIRPSRGGSAMGEEGVYAYEGTAKGRKIPPGRGLIEFEADPRLVRRNAVAGNNTVVVGGGRKINPADITGGYTSGGRMFSLLGGSPYGGLAGLLAGLVGVQLPRTPADWIMGAGLQDVRDEYGFVPGIEGAPTVLA